jgi:hypothetical protein
MDSYDIHLKPVSWVQTVRQYPGIKVGGWKLDMNCKPVTDRHFQISDGTNAPDLSISLSVFDTGSISEDQAKLERGFGLLAYRFTHLDGWFLLKPSDFIEVWEQVRDSRYSDCTVILTVAPVLIQELGCLWDVSSNKVIFIETAEIRFTHKLSAPEPPTRRGWFRR